MIFDSLKNIVWKSRLFMCCKMKTATELKIYHVIVRIKSGFLMLLEFFHCLRSIYKPCNLYLQLTFNVFWVIFTFAWTLVMVIQLVHASCMLLLAFDIVFSPDPIGTGLWPLFGRDRPLESFSLSCHHCMFVYVEVRQIKSCSLSVSRLTEPCCDVSCPLL